MKFKLETWLCLTCEKQNSNTSVLCEYCKKGLNMNRVQTNNTTNTTLEAKKSIASTQIKQDEYICPKCDIKLASNADKCIKCNEKSDSKEVLKKQEEKSNPQNYFINACDTIIDNSITTKPNTNTKESTEKKKKQDTWKCDYCNRENEYTVSTCRTCNKINKVIKEVLLQQRGVKNGTINYNEYKRLGSLPPVDRIKQNLDKNATSLNSYWKCNQCCVANNSSELFCYNCKSFKDYTKSKYSNNNNDIIFKQYLNDLNNIKNIQKIQCNKDNKSFNQNSVFNEIQKYTNSNKYEPVKITRSNNNVPPAQKYKKTATISTATKNQLSSISETNISGLSKTMPKRNNP